MIEASREVTHRSGGTVAERYRLERVVARGGMGVIWRAAPVDGPMAGGAAVALKLLHPSIAGDADARERFVREARAPAEIGHPGIVAVLDAGVDADDTLYLAMEWLEGKSLAAWMSAAPRPTRLAALERVRELLEPLAAAHARGFVHRDLKPDNVFLARDAQGRVRVKLLDFGIARRAKDDALTRTGAFLGTLRYVSPEQARSPKDVGPAADVWSVGVMLYEICAGRLPFDGEGAEQVLAAYARPHAPLVNVGVPAALSALVDRCLAKRPGDRPRDAAELRTALDAALAGGAVRAALAGEAPAVVAAGAAQTPTQIAAETRRMAPDDEEVSVLTAVTPRVVDDDSTLEPRRRAERWAQVADEALTAPRARVAAAEQSTVTVPRAAAPEQHPTFATAGDDLSTIANTDNHSAVTTPRAAAPRDRRGMLLAGAGAVALLVVAIAIGVSTGADSNADTVTAVADTATATATTTDTATATATATATDTATATATDTATDTATATATDTATATATDSVTDSDSASDSDSVTDSDSASASPSATATPTETTQPDPTPRRSVKRRNPARRGTIVYGANRAPVID